MKTLVFVSLPMRGYSDEEIKDRQEEIFNEFKANDKDAQLINPFEGKQVQMDMNDIAGRPDVYWLGHSIAALSYADVVIFAKEWENFPGCRIEHKVATYYGIPIRHA